MQTALRRSQRLQTKRFTSKTLLRKEFSTRNLIHLWQHFDLEFFSRTILRDFDNDRSDLIMLRSVERESHTDDITKASKKIFFLNRQKKSTKRVAKLKDEAKEKFNQKRRKRNLFLNRKTFLHFIFVFFTTHFRIHHLLFTAFFIHERRSLSMNFRKNHTKNSIWILNRSKWSSSRWVMRKTSISRMKDAWFLAWKKTFTIVNDNRDLHDVFSSRMRTRNDVFISNDWIRRFTVKENSKNQANSSLEREIQ
jgi:hypothetical protein